MELFKKDNDVIHLDMDEEFEGRNEQIAKDVEKKENPSYHSYFNIKYWQTYFDINQYELYDRLQNIVNPQRMEISEHVKQKPELYAPFWISTSLIFCLFACGNLSGVNSNQTGYNYGMISSAISVIYGYVLIVPLLVYLILKFQSSSAGFINVT